MNVTVKPEQEAFIRDQVESGKYDDADHVVEEAIRLFQEHKKLLYLRAAVAEARAQVARGEVVEWTSDFMDRLQREAADNVRNGKPIKSDVKPYD